MILELKEENFAEEIKTNLVLLDFHAVWCGPCKMMHPVIDQIAQEHPELKIIKIDVDQHEEISKEYGIMSIPTLILLENGELKQKNIGFTSKEHIENWLK